MCRYIYVYSSKCQHGELTRVTYCDTATALGLPRHDRHSSRGAAADNFSGAQPGPSPFYPPAPSASNSSSSHSHSHNQQQNHRSMSTLNASRAGASLACNAATKEQATLLPTQVAVTPRSASIDDSMPLNQTSSTINTSAQSGTLSYRNLNIEFPACTQSSLLMELTHDGKVTELVARFESYANYSDEAKVPQNEHTFTSSVAAHCPSDSEAQTDRIIGHESRDTVNDDAEEHPGPRKPIPAQWLPKCHGPNLATARRAQERSHKSDVPGSQATVKTIRGTRSSLELGKHNTENTTFLTKEALAAVENNLTSTPLRSPNKLHQSPSRSSRPSSNSNPSPQRNSTQQHAKLTIKMSPTRKTFLGADLAPSGHSRASSSVATSVGGKSFHTADGSPVRSSADSDMSFESAAEVLEDIDTQHGNIGTDSQKLQGAQSPSKGYLSASKAGTEVISSAIPLHLTLEIPPLPSTEPDDPSATAANSTTSSSLATLTSGSQNSPAQTSRIPRVSHTNKIGSARGATRSSTLKRVQSVKTLAVRAKAPEDCLEDQDHLELEDTSTAAPSRHVRTVDSSGTTPMVPIISIIEDTVDSYSVRYDPCTDSSTVQTMANEFDKLTINDATVSTAKPTREDILVSKHSSRAASSAAVTAPSTPQDDVIRMRNDVLETSNIGNNLRGAPSVVDEKDDATNATDNTTQVRGRTERYLPSTRRQVVSEHSMHSSFGSDLRATAPEFVPGVYTAQSPAVVPAGPMTVPFTEPGTSLDMFGLDRHEIPWMYYMYPVHFVYEQGFRKGRSRSPKKWKLKRQRPLNMPPIDGQSQPQRGSFPATDIRQETDAPVSITQDQVDAMLMPPPPLPASRLQDSAKGENSRPGFAPQHHPESKVDVFEQGRTFAPQFSMAGQQPATGEFQPRDMAQFQNFDASSIRRSQFNPELRDIRAPRYNTMGYCGPRQNRRHFGNGLYSGRGAAGVPMDSTFPFPDPMPPQGRPDSSQVHLGNSQQQAEYSLGTEACGLIDIVSAAERGGGDACNACAPDH